VSDAAFRGESIALQQLLDKWPRAEVAYAFWYWGGSLIGVGTKAGAARALKRFTAGWSGERHVKANFVKRSADAMSVEQR